MAWWLLSAAMAAVPVHGPVGLLADDLAAGVISEEDALFVRFQQMFEPEAVPARYAPPAEEEGWICGTALIGDLRARWTTLSRGQQEHIADILQEDWAIPGGEAAIDPNIPSAPRFRDGAPPQAPSSSCWSTSNANVLKSEHFQVQWASSVDQSTAQSFATALERGFDVQMADGWRQPDGMTAYLMDVTVSNDNYAGAYTTVRVCSGFYMPYIVAGRGSFRGGRWYQDMAAHEFNHAIQFGYGFAHQFWFWESTATYVQESVNPTHNEWAPYIEGYTDRPHLSMHASSQQDQNVFGHMYGMAIWNFYLDEHVGGPELNRGLWADSRLVDGEGSLWMDDALATRGYDFREVYEGFILNNTVMDFEESEDFGQVNTLARVTVLPYTGGVGLSGPEGRGQNYFRFEPGVTNESAPDLVVEFDGDTAGDWMVYLVGVNGTELTEVARFELIDGAGEARLSDAARFERAWLVVSPFNKDDRTYAYTFSSYADKAPREGLLGACGCQSQPSPAGLGGLATFAAALLLRRRRA